MRRVSLVVAMLIVIAACGDTPEEPADRGSAPGLEPLAVSPSTIEVLPEPPTGGFVLAVSAADVTHELWSANGCVYIRSTVPDEEPTVGSACDVLKPFWAQSTGDCFRYLPREESPGGTGDDYTTPVPDICEIEMTPAFYGYANEDVGWLCMARHDGEGSFGPVDYIETAGLFLVLQDPDVRWARAHPYTPDGKRWGAPPLDAPSSFIYAMCETDPPWDPTPAVQRYLYTLARLDPSLVGDDAAAVFLDTGTGAAGFSFGIDDGGIFEVGLEIWSDATELTVTYTDADYREGTLIGVYPLPEGIVAELTGGWECRDAAVLLVDVREAVRDADPNAVTLRALTSGQAAEMAGYSVTGYDTDRPPGTPCPESGTEPLPTATPDIEAVVEGHYRFVLAQAVIDLGQEWWINVFDADDTGATIALGEPPDELHPTYLFPGTNLRFSIEHRDEDDPFVDPVTVAVPPLPDGYQAPYLLQIEITGYDTSGPRPKLRPEDIRLAWVGS